MKNLYQLREPVTATQWFKHDDHPAVMKPCDLPGIFPKKGIPPEVGYIKFGGGMSASFICVSPSNWIVGSKTIAIMADEEFKAKYSRIKHLCYAGNTDCDSSGEWTCGDCSDGSYIQGITQNGNCHHCDGHNVTWHCSKCECEFCNPEKEIS